MYISLVKGETKMELNLNFLILPETYGGFGPDWHWLGLGPLPTADAVRPISPTRKIEECTPMEMCCQGA